MNASLKKKLEKAHQKVAQNTDGEQYQLETLVSGELVKSRLFSAVLGRYPSGGGSSEQKDFIKTRGGNPTDTEQDRWLNVLTKDFAKAGIEPSKLKKGGTILHPASRTRWKINAVMDEDLDSPFINLKLETK